MSTGSIGRNLFTSQSRGIGGRLGSRGLGEYRDPEREVRRFHLRLAAAGALVLIAFGVLFGRFVYLQVIQHSYYHTKAEDNRISVVPLPPNRGLIMDRTGVVLARNHSAYTLEIQPDQVDDLDATIDALAGVVDIQSRDRKRFKKLREDMRGVNYPLMPAEVMYDLV